MSACPAARWNSLVCGAVCGGVALSIALLTTGCSQVHAAEDAAEDAAAVAIRTQAEALRLLERSRELAQAGERQRAEELAFESDNLFATRFVAVERLLPEDQRARLRVEREEWEAQMRKQRSGRSAKRPRGR